MGPELELRQAMADDVADLAISPDLADRVRRRGRRRSARVTAMAAAGVVATTVPAYLAFAPEPTTHHLPVARTTPVPIATAAPGSFGLEFTYMPRFPETPADGPRRLPSPHITGLTEVARFTGGVADRHSDHFVEVGVHRTDDLESLRHLFAGTPVPATVRGRPALRGSFDPKATGPNLPMIIWMAEPGRAIQMVVSHGFENELMAIAEGVVTRH